MHCKRKLQLYAYNTCHCLLDVVTKGGLTVDLINKLAYKPYIYISMFYILIRRHYCIYVNFNPKKTKAMVFSNINLPNDVEITFQDKLVEFVTCHKHLGITFDSSGKFHTQMTGCEGSSKFIVPRNTNYFLTRSGGKYFVLKGTIYLLLPEITGF